MLRLSMNTGARFILLFIPEYNPIQVDSLKTPGVPGPAQQGARPGCPRFRGLLCITAHSCTDHANMDPQGHGLLRAQLAKSRRESYRRPMLGDSLSCHA